MNETNIQVGDSGELVLQIAWSSYKRGPSVDLDEFLFTPTAIFLPAEGRYAEINGYEPEGR